MAAKGKSKIRIAPSKVGTFTAAAKPGESTQAHASRVLNDPNASPAMRKKAQFAKNAARWHH